jgi:DNA-directed RNA polymerase specialized sigma24 family protein
MHYQRILAKYPKVCEPSHLMSLFQITFCNHLNDLSKKRTRLAEVPDGLDALPDIEDSLGWSEICRVITEAPPDVRRALKLLYVRGGKYADPEKRLGERLVTRVREYLCQTQYAGRIK